VALNLIRAYTSQIVTIYGRKERRTDQGLTQAPGIHKFHYAVYPHAGTWENGCLQQAEQLNYPLVPVQTHRTFGKLPSESVFVKIGSPKLAISALKNAGREDAVILRLYNPSTQPVEAGVDWLKDIAHVELVNLNEETLPAADPVSFQGRSFQARLGAKKIATYKLTFPPQS
jgi:alpha-mannosidase